MVSGEIATETNFCFIIFFSTQFSTWFSNSRDVLHIISIFTFGLERTLELFYWMRFYLSFTEISELGTNLRLITWTRIWLNIFRSIHF